MTSRQYLESVGYSNLLYEIAEPNCPFEGRNGKTFNSRLHYTHQLHGHRAHYFNAKAGPLKESIALERFAREARIREMEKQAAENSELRLQQRREASQYVGTLGQRMAFSGTVLWTRDFPKEIEGQEQEEGHISIIRTEDGNTLKYWNLLRAGPKEEKIELLKGARAEFRATVVAHEEYRGERQTVIQRAYVTRVL